MAYTKEELEAQRATLRRHLDVVDRELAGSGGDLTATVQARDENAALWDKLSPAEKMELYQNDRERWNTIKDAYEAEGVRKLFNKKLVP